MGEIASEGSSQHVNPITFQDISELENKISAFEARIRLGQDFIIPGEGGPASAALDLARTISRRLERRAVLILQTKKISEELYTYLNRISDYLFLLSIAAKEVQK